MMRDPWERLKGESSKAYAHFCLYRDMGKERSLRKLAADTTCTSQLRQLQRWSARWRWVDRAQAYDDEIYRELRAKNEKQIVEAADRQARLGRVLQSKSVEKMANLDGNTLTVTQATMLAKIGAELEARALGMPTQIIKSQVTHKDESDDYSKKTDDELRDEGIAALVNSGMSRENAALIVDQMSGGKRDERQRKSEPGDANGSGNPMAEGPPEG